MVSKFAVIKTLRARKNEIQLILRDLNTGKRVQKRVIDFYPYCYINKEDLNNIDRSKIIKIENTNLVHIKTKKQMIRLYFKEAFDVGEFKQDHQTYESDIPYPRRFMIDMNISDAITAPDSGSYNVLTKDIKAVTNPIMYKPLILYYDIEVLHPDGIFPKPEDGKYPVLSICYKTNYSDKYKLLLFTTRNQTFEKYEDSKKEIIVFNKEEELLKEWVKILKNIGPDILTCWNQEFDNVYVENRINKLVPDLSNSFKSEMYKINLFDLMIGYNILKMQKAYQKLKSVVVVEELVTQDEVDLIDVGNTWRTADYDLFFKYAFNDVLFLDLIDGKLEVMNYFFEIKMTFGLEDMEKTMAYSSPIDTVLLKFAKNEFNYVLPNMRSRTENGDEHDLKGAIVFDPPKGVIDNVAVFDFSKFYPSIILTWNLSPDNPTGDLKGRYLIPAAVDVFSNERAKYDKILNGLNPSTDEWKIMKRKRDSKKGCLNALYGIHGARFSRLYDLPIAKKITGTARDGLIFLRKKAKKHGFETIYGDTDSIFIKTNSIKESLEVEKLLNAGIMEFAKSLGVTKHSIKLNFEKFYARIGFGGVKKRYFGRIIYQDGQDTEKVDIVGFENVRSDASKLTRRLQELLFKLILYHKGPESRVTVEVRNILRQTYLLYQRGSYKLAEIAVPKGMNKKLSEYTTNIDFVRGVKYVKEHLPHIGGNIEDYERILMFFISTTPSKYPKTDVLCCSTEDAKLVGDLMKNGFELDWRRQFERNIVGPMDPIVDMLNVDMLEVTTGMKQKSLLSFLG